MPESRSAELADAVAAGLAELLAVRASLEHGAPWPLAARFDHADETVWGPPEILAHVAEMARYWTGEMARVLDGAGRGLEPVPFGRTADDDVRSAIIGRDRSLPVAELLGWIESDGGRLEGRLRALTDADLATRGRHPIRGEMTVRDLVQRFVVAHLHEHVEQLRPLLARA